MPSNPILNVNGESLARLKLAMALADDYNEGDKRTRAKTVNGFAVNVGRLVFFQYDSDKGMTPFPTPVSLDRAAEIAFDWLGAQEYSPEPDHDGSNSKGWRLWRDTWGRIDGYGHAAFVAIEPFWIEYGK